MRIGLGVFVVALLSQVQGLNRLETVYKWKMIDFEFPSPADREESIRNREFIPGNPVPMDVDVYTHGQNRAIFVTLPKFKDGIPVTFGTVSNITRGDCQLVTPFPDWSWHTQRGCDGLTSVFRTQIDRCARLWVIDSGMVDLSLPTRRKVCNPQIVAFNLRTNQLFGSHRFTEHVLKEGSLLVNLAVDVRGNSENCHDTMVYAADVTTYALLVFDARNNKAWRVESNTFYPYPPYGVFKANNAEFDLMDGVIGLALTPEKSGDKTLYYHSLASVRESWVPTSVIREETHFANRQNSVPRRFHTSPEARKSQSIAEAFDRSGILYFGMMDDNSLNCWNSDYPYKSSNLHQLEQDNSNLQFSSGMKVITNENNEEELWIMTNRFQLVMTNEMSPNEYNFRILRGKVQDLLRNSACRMSKEITFPNRTETTTVRPYRSTASGHGYGYGR